MDLNFLECAAGTEISDRSSVTFRQTEGRSLTALLSWNGLSEIPRWSDQVQRAVVGDGEVPREAVEGHRQRKVQKRHGEGRGRT